MDIEDDHGGDDREDDNNEDGGEIDDMKERLNDVIVAS